MATYIVETHDLGNRFVVSLGKGYHRAAILANRKYGVTKVAQLHKRLTEYEKQMEENKRRVHKMSIPSVTTMDFPSDKEARQFCIDTQAYLNM